MLKSQFVLTVVDINYLCVISGGCISSRRRSCCIWWWRL